MARRTTPIPARARREEIARLAASSGPASVEELSRRFEVTPSTIRRDLSRLAEEGALARTYGGAIPLAAGESTLRERESEAHPAKRALGAWARRQIRPGEHVLLDGGSTVGELARELAGAGPEAALHVTALGLNALHRLEEVEGIELVSPGGAVRRSSQSFIGPITEAALSRMTFDRAYLSSDGVTAEHGLCEAGPEQTRLKELMAAQSAEVTVLADSTKLGHRPFHSWARLPLPWTLVTDDGADPRQLELFRRSGVEVQVVDLP
ncbi:DeoR/GlpR family DNA-binding transcription regulator [Brachybacterium phenoliresistens]|uniref:DeoR/GlpR family DNA-binding transcription regulator n=1 Tax=Brachybacterium phenoliresistens TaxID=396014 RepID=UPI0004B24C6E|nr:DeoR/GlpR family DNA-binding transcription regulator [Brachybacterium phenoliresistens]